MENYLLNHKFSSISITGALYKQIKSGDWNNNRELDVNNFMNIHDKVLTMLQNDDTGRQKKIMNFGMGEHLRKRVSLIS